MMTLSSSNYKARRRHWISMGSPKWQWLGGALIIVLAVVYIGLTNDVSTQGYRLKSIQQEAKKIEEVNSALEIQSAAAQSLQRLEAETAALALMPVERIEYLSAADTAVAVR